MKKLRAALSLSIVFVVFVASIFAYFLRSIDKTGIVSDGFGRVLNEPPVWAKLFITEEKVWAGFSWHLFDAFWFFSALYIAFMLYDPD